MTTWIRTVAAVVGTLWLLGSSQAAPPSGDPQLPTSKAQREKPFRPAPEGPQLIPRICNTGPAPQVTLEVKKVYVGLKWAAVPNARTYWVARNVVGSTATGVNLTTTDPFLDTEYWDAVPDIRNNYEYTVTAVQPDGCTGSTKVTVSGPYALPHPTGTGGSHPGSIVQTQQPQGGAMAPRGSAVTVNTVALAGGFSEITLYNNMQQQRSVNAWLFDMAAGSWSGGRPSITARRRTSSC